MNVLTQGTLANSRALVTIRTPEILYSVTCGRTIMTTLAGQKFLCFVGDDYEDLEVWYPRLRLIEAGAAFHLAGQEAGKKYVGKNGYPCVSDILIKGIDVAAYDGLICAGGWMPDKLRRDPEVLRITREFAHAGKLVAAICHGGWMPISAGVYKGVKVTGSPGIKDDLVNAGAIFEDASVVVDRHFVSSRKPDDLPDFCKAILKVCGKA
ncbi:MAG: type 1 glutamine amidotransferase [Planctomycetales bacterium]|jgi:protease I|nr:type 1 glutamine amidotransferase [Planctomycetales bacterium]